MLSPSTERAPRWRHVAAFCSLTFALTYLLDLAIYLHGGLTAPTSLPAIQFQMLLPAFSAIVLGLFAFPESPLWLRRASSQTSARAVGGGRWFYFYFLLFTLLVGLGVLGVWVAPSQTTALVASLAPPVGSLLGLILLIVLRVRLGRDEMTRVGLAWGHWRDWLLFGVAFVVWYVVQIALNAWLGLGGAQVSLPPGVPGGLDPPTFIVLAALQSVILGPFLGLLLAFGEEYGWRGYLQTELVRLGRVRGVLLVGVIWGAWHWPLILMGFNYPGHALLGLLLMTLYTTGLAVVLGYVVFRSGSVLLAAYLHAMNDQVVGFLVAIGFRPFDAAFAFGIGTYGLLTLAILALLLLRSSRYRTPSVTPRPA